MIEVEITEGIIKKAKEWHKHIIKSDRATINANGWLVGRIGTLIVADHYDIPPTSADEQYDILVGDQKTEVKTKPRNEPPLPYYDGTVPAQSLDLLDADQFVFVSLYKQEKAYIMGTMSVGEFLEKSTAYKKGDVDLSNNFTHHTAAYNITYKELHGLEVLV